MPGPCHLKWLQNKLFHIPCKVRAVFFKRVELVGGSLPCVIVGTNVNCVCGNGNKLGFFLIKESQDCTQHGHGLPLREKL